MKVFIQRSILSIALIFLFHSITIAAIGQSAIITLSFPYGARSTGLGETFTGIADNVDATFYNPAGLGQAPLANTWKVHNPTEKLEYTAIASLTKRAFGKKEKVWVGTNTQGLFLYNGKAWANFYNYVIEENDNLQDLAKKFLNTDDELIIHRAVQIIKKKNNIQGKRLKKIVSLLTPHVNDSLKQADKPTALIEKLAWSILDLEESKQNALQVYGLIATKVDTAMAYKISDDIVTAFSINDVNFTDLVELKIPFQIAIQDSITVLKLDASERLWVGTNNGLWRYNNVSWISYTMMDGLPSNRIQGIALGPHQQIAVATDQGVALHAGGEWTSYSENEGLIDNNITSITFGENKSLYVGTSQGLQKKKGDQWLHFDSSDGMLSSQVTALYFDSEKKLWIGGKEGITLYDEVSWKRYKFPGSIINCFHEYRPGRVWIGTNKGAISYRAGKVRTDDNGAIIQEPPKWKPFHSKNALAGNIVTDISVHGKDVWLITEEAINQYDRGDMQASIFFEPLLPAFDLPDLWHTSLHGTFPTEEWGTIGFYLNYLSFGKNVRYDAHGRELDEFQSYEYVLSLCYGLQVKEDLSLGFNIKYAHSALAPGTGEGNEGVGKTFAVDLSILKRNLFLKNLSLGFTIMNMGPSVYYINREEADPIPFTLRLGLAYTILQTPSHFLLAAIDVDREIVYNELYKSPDPFWKALFRGLNDEPWRDEVSEIIGHIGLEYWYVYFLALRMGVMIDEAGSRRELSLGLGLRYGNMNVDWSYIHSPEKSIARDGQWRFSFTYTQ